MLYKFFLEFSYPDLPLDRLWRQDYPALDPEFDWEDWDSIKEASRNPKHQQIHFNLIRRTYLTPRKLETDRLSLVLLLYSKVSRNLLTYDVGLSSSNTVLV